VPLKSGRPATEGLDRLLPPGSWAVTATATHTASNAAVNTRGTAAILAGIRLVIE
jgi:hypothetical protein